MLGFYGGFWYAYLSDSYFPEIVISPFFIEQLFRPFLSKFSNLVIIVPIRFGELVRDSPKSSTSPIFFSLNNKLHVDISHMIMTNVISTK